MTEKWQEIPEMAGVRIARIEDGDPNPSSARSGLRGASHSMVKLVIQPGSAIEPLGDVHAVNLHVQDGALRVSISEGDATVRVAGGDPIQSGDGDIYCEQDRREMRIGESAVLRSGNTFAIRDGVMHMAVDGDAPAELQMSVVKNEPGDEDDEDDMVKPRRCWVCPFT